MQCELMQKKKHDGVRAPPRLPWSTAQLPAKRTERINRSSINQRRTPEIFAAFASVRASVRSLGRRRRSIFFHVRPFTRSRQVHILKAVSESSHGEEMSSRGHVLGRICFKPSNSQLESDPVCIVYDFPYFPTDVAALACTRIHTENAHKSTAQPHVLIYTSKHPSIRDRKLCVTHLKSNVFPPVLY